MSSLAPRRKLVSAAALDKGAEALAARHGAASNRPALRPDLIIRRQVQVGETFWLVKNPDTQKLFSFNEAMWGLISLFDGTRTHTEIADYYNRTHPGNDIDLALVHNFEEQLAEMGCLAQSAAQRNLELLSKFKTARQRAADEKSEGFNPFFIQFHVVDPNRFLDRTVKYVRWLWSPPAVAVVLIFYAMAIGVIIQNFAPIWAQTLVLYNFFGKAFWDAVQFFFILTCIGCIHEYAHGYVCKMYGGQVHDIGMALLYFTPAFYCDTTDSLLFENRWQKMWVTTAGIYVEGIMCTLATGLWVASYPDTLIHEIAYKTMLFTGISTVFFNINPLIKIDGYYALTHLVEDPNLREGAFAYLGAWFQRYVLRLNVEVPVLPKKKRRIYATYSILAICYTSFVMILIGNIFNNLYQKLWPNLATVLLIVTLYQIFKKRARVAFRVGKLFYLDKKEYLMSRKIRWRLATAGAVIVLLLAVPWARRTIQAPVVLKPERQLEIRAPENAVVSGVLARGAQDVRRGDELLTLTSVAQRSRLSALDAQGANLRREVNRFLAADQPDAAFAARQKLLASESALSRERAQGTLLTVKSPINGRILTPHPEELEGEAVAAGELLLNVGECRALYAEIPVTERLLTTLSAGEPVFLQLRALPMTTLKGGIVSIAAAPLPPATAAGPVPDQPLTASKPAKFVAVARFDNSEGRLLPGMQGIARISIGRTSYLSRAFGVVYRWLGTIVW